MEPRSAPARATAAAGPRPPTFASQTNALLRKNLIFQVRSPTDNRYGILLPLRRIWGIGTLTLCSCRYQTPKVAVDVTYALTDDGPCFIALQKRNRKGTIRLIIVPIYLCLIISVLQRVINNLLDKPKFKCGCKCVDVNGTGPCQNVCGIQYSTPDQAPSCPIQNPPNWPVLVQVPLPEYRAVQDSSIFFTGLPDSSCRKTQSCPASIPFTGTNRTLSNSIMQNLFTDSPLSNLSDHTSIFSGLLGTDIPGFTTGFIDPAFDSERSIYVLDPQCKSSDSVTVTITIGSANAQKGIGYRKGKTAEGINEIAMVILTTTVTAAYDFQDSNEKNFKVLTLYNSTYQNVSFIPMPLGLLRISRSLNAVSNAYLQLVQGSGFKMLLDFTKEMPKQATRLTFDFSAVVGPLFFEWVVVLLFPVMLTYLVYEKQHKLRTMMKMHGLGDGPYWIIYYMYFLIFSTVYMILFVIFGSIVMAFLASSFFSKVNTAQGHWITVLEIIPAFSLYRGLYELGQYAITASETGVGQTSSPLSIIKRLLKKDRASRRITVNEIADKDVHVEMEKLDIITERETVDQVLQEQNSGYAVVCDDLKKVYHGKDGNPDKFAVQGVSLALPYGECLGILGPNGAGKSSFISMVCYQIPLHDTLSKLN
ncbi:hypothetical protein HU200_063087 [Digitaria exilis]|uniref:ABC transporter domain-containing protein n=1 Tax=Digitaria exilis TaxID=1010633 RepID=A0A835A2D9_9POAL|nr:hypothetical protein HU200_063087 [Digitaria exilis]